MVVACTTRLRFLPKASVIMLEIGKLWRIFCVHAFAKVVFRVTPMIDLDRKTGKYPKTESDLEEKEKTVHCRSERVKPGSQLKLACRLFYAHIVFREMAHAAEQKNQECIGWGNFQIWNKIVSLTFWEEEVGRHCVGAQTFVWFRGSLAEIASMSSGWLRLARGIYQ